MSQASPCCPLCGGALPDDGLFISPDHGLVVRGNARAQLTISEMDIFALLHRRRPRVVTVDAIMDALYHLRAKEPGANIVPVFISRMRPRLRPLGLHIVNHHGLGFSLAITEDAACNT